MAERSNAAVLKTVIPRDRDRGFESHSLLQSFSTIAPYYMINFILALKGFLIGIIISLPIGPIGILCLRRMILQGPIIGIASGLGAATADLIFSLITVIGLGVFLPFFALYIPFIKIASSIVLVFLGIYIIKSNPLAHKPEGLVHNPKESYLSALGLTIANPLIIFSLAALLTGLGIDLLGITNYQALLIALSIFAGCASWWLLLSAITKPFHLTLKPEVIAKINRAAGGCILVSALLILLSSILS